ncbi:MAG: hypothetical protein M3405_16730 [Acidobacteriota bacterium]|nr:hypothetical protein [Acidobacteriota bacterium]
MKSLRYILIKGTIFSTVLIALTFVFGLQQVPAQRNDHLTDKETELVREAQEIDRRMEVFIKAIERRFLVLENKSETLSKKEAKQIEKDSELWGDLPTSSRTKLLSDIEEILNEAINNIDDAASRDSKSQLFPKAVYKLADAAKEFVPKLKTFYDSAKTEREQALTYQAIEYCNMIIEASSKVGKPVEKTNKQKKDKS